MIKCAFWGQLSYNSNSRIRDHAIKCYLPHPYESIDPPHGTNSFR